MDYKHDCSCRWRSAADQTTSKRFQKMTCISFHRLIAYLIINTFSQKISIPHIFFHIYQHMLCNFKTPQPNGHICRFPLDRNTALGTRSTEPTLICPKALSVDVGPKTPDGTIISTTARDFMTAVCTYFDSNCNYCTVSGCSRSVASVDCLKGCKKEQKTKFRRFITKEIQKIVTVIHQIVRQVLLR